MDFTLVYQDENIAALNKRSGIAVSPDRWDLSLERLDKQAAEYLKIPKLFTVHRLDRETSGLVIFAKNAETHRELSRLFESRKIVKRYIAIVRGRPSWKEESCDLPLIPNGNKRHLTIIDKFRGKKSLTNFRLLGTAGNYGIVEALPLTGRTHQIRVHLAALGHAVVCDEFYGNNKGVLLSSFKKGWRGDPKEERPLLARLGLHALELHVPEYNEQKNTLVLKAELPKDMKATINQMEKATNTVINLWSEL